MHWIKVHWTLALCFIPLGVGQAMDARAADMTKTLHVAFANAEGGFDSQASNDNADIAPTSAIRERISLRSAICGHPPLCP